MYDELGIGNLVDTLIPQDHTQRTISVGQALKAMVLNGLGFANRRLYLTSHFFTNKPTERLIGIGVKPEHLNDDALGQALDDIHAFGVTELFSEIAARAAKRLGITPKVGHMDSSSFHVDGNYNSDEPPDKDDAVIHVTHGYSRDHRPDLNQAVLQLIIEQQANLPILMEPLNGNSNDKTAFADTITKHVGQLTTAYGLSLMISDSAGFTTKCLHAYEQHGVRWVMSVPGTIKRAKELLEQADPESMQPLGEGYSYQQVIERYAGIEQRWLIIESEAAKARASKSVSKTLLKQSEDEQKRFARLCRQSFSCEQDASAALEAFQKSLKVLEVISHEVITKAHYPKAGRPARDAVADRVSYYLAGVLAAPLACRERMITKRSCFILATNELDESVLSDEEVLVPCQAWVDGRGVVMVPYPPARG